MLHGMWLSLHVVDIWGDGRFAGLANYGRLLADPVFGQSLINTFVVTLMVVPILTVIALALALALNRASRGAAVLRGIFFSSAVLSVTIVTLIWRFILAPDAGLLGEAAQALGAEPLPFLSSPSLALWALAITTIWWSIGLPMLLFLAGLQQVPGDLYEAAALDRASRWRTFARDHLAVAEAHHHPGRDAADRGATAVVRPGAIADRRRPERRIADGRAVHERGRVRAVGTRLCAGRRRSAVRDHPGGDADPILADRPGGGGRRWPLTP